MDNYDLVFDLIKNPDKYSTEQIEAILSNPEAREIYNLLCKTASSMIVSADTPDVNAEWKRFTQRNCHHRFFSWVGSKAASITAFALTSFAAIAISIAVTVTVIKRKSEPIPVSENVNIITKIENDSIAEVIATDTVSTVATTILYEDATLKEIMSAVEKRYSVNATYLNDRTADLHLYYRFDPTLTLDEVIEQLNTFEQINICRKDNTLTID